MKKILSKTILLCFFIVISTTITGFSDFDTIYRYDNIMDKNYVPVSKPTLTLLYDNIWATIYNAEVRQCDNTPTLTGDGSKINLKKASNYRWIAISQEMLNCTERQKMLVYDRTNLYKGKIKYGDTIWIESPYKRINGWWVVHDTKNASIHNSIDFLQTKGDTYLYNNNKLWSGKFDNIKIYKLKNLSYRQYSKRMSI